jgi:hypothetical protein
MNQPGYAPVRTSGVAPIGTTVGRPISGGVQTTTYVGAPTTQSYGLGGDPERRLNEASARQLARMVFLKYDDNDSGSMNSNEAANLITDLYASVNMEYRATPDEGKEFMKANDSDRNWQYDSFTLDSTEKTSRTSSSSTCLPRTTTRASTCSET